MIAKVSVKQDNFNCVCVCERERERERELIKLLWITRPWNCGFRLDNEGLIFVSSQFCSFSLLCTILKLRIFFLRHQISRRKILIQPKKDLPLRNFQRKLLQVSGVYCLLLTINNEICLIWQLWKPSYLTQLGDVKKPI